MRLNGHWKDNSTIQGIRYLCFMNKARLETHFPVSIMMFLTTFGYFLSNNQKYLVKMFTIEQKAFYILNPEKLCICDFTRFQILKTKQEGEISRQITECKEIKFA